MHLSFSCALSNYVTLTDSEQVQAEHINDQGRNQIILVNKQGSEPGDQSEKADLTSRDQAENQSPGNQAKVQEGRFGKQVVSARKHNAKDNLVRNL